MTQSHWQTMDSAPTDGSPIFACRRWDHTDDVWIHVYRYEGHPNYWHARSAGTCIRPEYQHEYLWCSLPEGY